MTRVLQSIDSVLDGIVRQILAWLAPWLEPAPRPRVATMRAMPRRRRVHAPIELPPDDEPPPPSEEVTRVSRVNTRMARREELGLVPLGAGEMLTPETGDFAFRKHAVVVRVAVEDEPTTA